MEKKMHSSYLVTSESDKLWGMVVSSVGSQHIEAGKEYPPAEHPVRYLFSPASGRVLNEYQLLYIAEGSGTFRSESTGRKAIQVCAGDMFMLFPGEWHSYCPNAKTGWKEYWIGFSGSIPDKWVSDGFFEAVSPVFHTGLKHEIQAIYEQAINFANMQESSYQIMLASSAIQLISTALFYDKNNKYRESSVDSLFQNMRNNISMNLATITPEQLASDMGIGYSKFRKMFKEYTNISPGKYILEMRINRAKELLTNTNMQVQEIAWEIGCENADYFVTLFKNSTGLKPGDYRRSTKQSPKP